MLTGADPNAIIVFGSVVAIILIITLGTIIKTWLKKDSGGQITENREFLAALREFKENMERRVSNLEAIVTDENKVSSSKRKQHEKKLPQRNLLDIEIDSEAPEADPVQKTKLKNMLNQ
jgi:hypothetical protein